MICNICSANTCTHHGFCHFPGCQCWCGCPFRWYWWLRKNVFPFNRHWNLTKNDIKCLGDQGYSRVLYMIDDIPPAYLPEKDINYLHRMWGRHNAGEPQPEVDTDA